MSNCLLSCNLVNQSVLFCCQDFVLLSKDFVKKITAPCHSSIFYKKYCSRNRSDVWHVHVCAGWCGVCVGAVQMCVTWGVLYLKTRLYFIGHFPSFLQSPVPGPCPSKADIELSSFFNSASCPGFNKASWRVERIWGLLGGGRGRGWRCERH